MRALHTGPEKMEVFRPLLDSLSINITNVQNSFVQPSIFSTEPSPAEPSISVLPPRHALKKPSPDQLPPLQPLDLFQPPNP